MLSSRVVILVLSCLLSGLASAQIADPWKDWLSADRATVLGSGAFGLRFFTGQHGALTLEMRNYIFGDRFLVKVDRSVSEAGGTTGTLSPRPGLINLVLLNVGYTVIF